LISKSGWFLTPKDRTVQTTAAREEIRVATAVESLETVRLSKDATVPRTSLSVSPIRNDYSTGIGAATIAHDLTGKGASKLTRSMTETNLDLLVTLGTEGTITDTTEALAMGTCVPREKLIGTSLSGCCTDPAETEKIRQRMFARAMAMDHPLTLRHQDGALTDVLDNATLNRRAGVLAAACDVTKHMQAQRGCAQQQVRELAQLAELEQLQRLTVGRELT